MSYPVALTASGNTLCCKCDTMCYYYLTREVVFMSATMIKDTNFNMRMNKQKKTDLEELYGNLGMTLAEAVNIFFEKSLMEGGIPFDVRMPKYNKETISAINEAKDIMSGKVEAKSYGSAKELFDELDEQ